MQINDVIGITHTIWTLESNVQMVHLSNIQIDELFFLLQSGYNYFCKISVFRGNLLVVWWELISSLMERLDETAETR